LQALQVKFAKVAQLEFGSKEKRVSWSPQESEFGPPSPDNNMANIPSNCIPAVLARRSKYRRTSNLDKQPVQLNKQVHLATLVSTFATSLRKQDAGAELEQASKGERPPNLVPAVPGV
jgi:hypothetical protein